MHSITAIFAASLSSTRFRNVPRKLADAGQHLKAPVVVAILLAVATDQI